MNMKKILLIISFALLLLVGCGKPKIKTYTLAEKEAYLEKAKNGDEEAREFIKQKVEEYQKLYAETGSPVADKERSEWIRMQFRLPSRSKVVTPPW